MTPLTLEYERGTLVSDAGIGVGSSSEVKDSFKPILASNFSGWKRSTPPGVFELNWFTANLEHLSGFRGLWIALRGFNIVGSGPSLESVHDHLSQVGISDALIVHVPEGNVAKWDFLLA